MKKTIILYTFFFLNIVYSQSTLMVVNKDTILTSDFERNQKKSLEYIGVKETITNFVNFNLLKQYAVNKGVYNSLAFQVELTKESEKMKDSLYYPTELIEPVLKDYYQKMMTEKKIQLLIFKDNILPKNNDQQNKFIKNLRVTVNNNPSNFEKEVEKYSSILKYKAPVYFDVFSLDKDIVDIIYKTPLNQLTEFKTVNYTGFILVSREREYLGEVALEEIFINDTSDKGNVLAQTIYQELQQNKNILEIKRKYKANLTPDSNKGLYSDIEDDTLYNCILKVTKPTVFPPIKTENGYKIFKYLFRENYNSYTSARSKLYSRLKQSNEINRLNTSLVQELKGYSFYKENSKEIDGFINSLPQSYEKFQNMKLANEVSLINIGTQYELTTIELLEQIKQISKEDYIEIKTYTKNIIDSWINKSVINYYDIYYDEIDRIKPEWKNLEEQLLTKYAISIITDQAQKDTEGQKEFLEKEASRFTWEERIEGTLFYCLNFDVEKEVLQMLKEKKSVNYISEHFKGRIDSNDNKLLVIEEGKYTRESINLPLTEKLSKKIYTVDYKSRKLVIKIDEIIKDERMSLKELQTTYINEYVDYKINKTIEQLKAEAVISINKIQQEKLEEKYGI